MNAMPEIIPLFATPLVTFDVPEAAALNLDLRRVMAALTPIDNGRFMNHDGSSIDW